MYMYKNAKIILIIIVLAALAAVAAAYVRSGQSSRESRTMVPEAQPQKIRIANIGIYSNYNVLADKLGFFRANSLDASVDEYDSGGTSMGALMSGKADVAVAADFVGVRNMFSNSDIRILATVSSHDVWRLAARTNRIVKPSDLKGKTVGLTRKTAGEYYLGKFLAANRLTLDDVVMADLSATDIAGQLESGKIDAAMMFDPNAFRFLRAHPGFAAWPTQGHRRVLATLYTTSAFANDHPDTLERYLRALVAAERYQSADEESAKRTFAAAMGYDDDTMSGFWPDFTFAVRLDQELLLTMEDQARWNITNGLESADRIPNFLSTIYFAALEKADPEAVTIIRP